MHEVQLSYLVLIAIKYDIIFTLKHILKAYNEL